MSSQSTQSGADRADFSLRAMRQTLRRGLPKTVFRPKPRGGLYASALGPAIFLLIVGGFWLLSDHYSTNRAGVDAAGARSAYAGAAGGR
ncbi:MAG TPA: hypothetical protein VNH64_11125 [Parvularculaceae bacterium]|nr:hypothetical protein [Parvularculaceae bacterium]